MKSIRPLLGTYVTIEVRHISESMAAAAVDEAFSAIEKVQRLMSAFETDSDVYKINQGAHLAPVKIHPWTSEILRLAKELHVCTDGLFNCGIAPRLADWDMLPSDEITYTESSIDNLQITDDHFASCKNPTRIDLGGIAKGYAVDRAMETIFESGALSAIVNAGGDLRVMGDIEEPIYLRDPKNPGQMSFAGTLKDGALASSGTYFSKKILNEKIVSAIVNPLTQEPLISDHSFTVIAPQCVIADALTKVLALTGHGNMACFSKYSAQSFII